MLCFKPLRTCLLRPFFSCVIYLAYFTFIATSFPNSLSFFSFAFWKIISSCLHLLDCFLLQRITLYSIPPRTRLQCKALDCATASGTTTAALFLLFPVTPSTLSGILSALKSLKPFYTDWNCSYRQPVLHFFLTFNDPFYLCADVFECSRFRL